MTYENYLTLFLKCNSFLTSTFTGCVVSKEFSADGSDLLTQATRERLSLTEMLPGFL